MLINYKILGSNFGLGREKSKLSHEEITKLDAFTPNL